MRKKNIFWRFLYKLHRYTGLVSAVVLIVIAITGIALNHTEDFELDSNMVQSPALLNWYGIKAPEQIISFSTKYHWICLIDQQLYFDNFLLLNNQKELIGVSETDDFIVIASQEALILISPQGEFIESIPLSNLEKIGSGKQGIIIQSEQGLRYSDDDLMTWNSIDSNETINWSIPSQLPNSIAEDIKNQFRTSVLPLERVFLDIHSGRFFGLFGVIIVDISGVLLIILALSGCAVWVKHKLRTMKRK